MKNNISIAYKTGKLSQKDWQNILNKFDDASLYQTDAFTKHSAGGEKAEHFWVTKDDKIISAANVRIKTIPKLNRGVAYLRWGPLWKLKNIAPDIENLKIALELLKKEYVIKRKLVLRIVPNHFIEDETDYVAIFQQQGFNKFQPEDKTIIIDLTQDEETLRKNFRKQWRYRLKLAEKKELQIIKGNSTELFNEFFNIYKEMHSRKNFKETISVESFKSINEDLPEENKLQIFICKQDEQPLSAMVSTAMGNTGIYLLGGSTAQGLKMSSSYLLQWETMMWLKSIGIKWYDLGGIDKEANPGVYTFKSGMRGNEITFIGGYEASIDFISKIILKFGEIFK